MKSTNYSITTYIGVSACSARAMPSPYFVLRDAPIDRSTNDKRTYVARLMVALRRELEVLSLPTHPHAEQSVARVLLLRKLLRSTKKLEMHSYKKGVGTGKGK